MPRRIETPEGGYRRLPALKADDLDGADFCVTTILEVQDNIPVADPNTAAKKFKARLRLAAFPERNFWPNVTSRKHLAKRLGADTRGWTGAVIVLEVVEVDDPNTGQPTLSVWVAEPKDWNALIAKAKSEETPTPTPTPTPTAPATSPDSY